MSTAAPPLGAVAPALRPTWRRSFLAATLGVLAGGLASGALIGATVVVASLAGGGPIEDDIGNALEPLSVGMVVPIVAAVLVDALCRREVFWLVTGMRPTQGVTIFTAFIAPAAAVGIGWRGGVIAYVLVVSTVLLRCCAERTAASPRWFVSSFMARSRSVPAATAAGALIVAAAGLLAFQIGTPALGVSGRAITPSGALSARHIALTSRVLVPVTVIGIEGPEKDYVRLAGVPAVPFVLHPGETVDASLTTMPGCKGFSGSFSGVDVRYRILGLERVSFVDLDGLVSLTC